MTSAIYCKYCHHHWKTNTEYDKHIRCCEYFYQQRRTPSQPQMTETGTPIPNIRQLYKYIQDLSYRLEKTEKELRNLKNVVNSRRRLEVLECLNQPEQIPTFTFEKWVSSINATEIDMLNVLNGDIVDGILSCIYSAIETYGDQNILPMRCFSQKPGTFYVFSKKTTSDTSDICAWQTMTNEHIIRLLNHIAKSLRAEFRVWNTAKICGNMEGGFDQNFMDKMPRYVKKLNCDVEKHIHEIKKLLFTKMAENLSIADLDV
jgi:hypothetical protein